ncbi:MAG: NAD(P)-dependent oxidoreductase [Eubacteriales bacterium]|nr:NAD(P)-dependent oxidoreductase [Eubacteriales bacterium]
MTKQNRPRPRAVITGATGVIGRALLQKCLDEEMEVLALVHPGSVRAAAIPPHPLLTVQEAGLEEYGALRRGEMGGSNYDFFFHLAWRGTFGTARDDMALQTENIAASLEAVRLAKALGCRAFVGAGSQAEYGRTDGVLRPETPAFPENGYGMAKLCAGQMTRRLAASLGLRHIWVRVLSVYGPHDGEKTLISSAIRAMMAGEETAFTPGGQLWDYLYSGDAARAFLLAAQKGRDGAVYCLGGGEARLLSEYIRIIAQETGYQGEIGFGRLAYAPGQVMRLQADLSALTADTGFMPKTEFREGIRRTIAAMRQEGNGGVALLPDTGRS